MARSFSAEVARDLEATLRQYQSFFGVSDRKMAKEIDDLFVDLRRNYQIKVTDTDCGNINIEGQLEITKEGGYWISHSTIYRFHRFPEKADENTLNIIAVFFGFYGWKEFRNKELVELNERERMRQFRERQAELQDSSRENVFNVLDPKYLKAKDFEGLANRLCVPEAFYFRREIDAWISETLKARRSIVVTGNPLAGKTRAIFQAIKGLDFDSVMIPKYSLSKFKEPVINIPNGSAIAVFDDIDESLIKYPKDYLESLLLTLLKNQVVIAISCRTGDEWRKFDELSDKVRENLLELQLHPMTDEVLVKFDEYRKKRDPRLELPIDHKFYDRNIGSMMMGLTKMNQRYSKLEKHTAEFHRDTYNWLPRKILTVLKSLHFTSNAIGKDTYSWQTTKFIVEHLCQQQFSMIQWEIAIDTLDDDQDDLNFLSIVNGDLVIERAYLFYVVERDLLPFEVIDILLKSLSKEELKEAKLLDNQFQFMLPWRLCQDTTGRFEILERMYFLELEPGVLFWSEAVEKAENVKNAIHLFRLAINSGFSSSKLEQKVLDWVESFEDALKIYEILKEQDLPIFTDYRPLLAKAKNFDEALKVVDLLSEKEKKDMSVQRALIECASLYENKLLLIGKLKLETVEAATFYYRILEDAASFEDALKILDALADCNLNGSGFLNSMILDRTTLFQDAILMLSKLASHKFEISGSFLKKSIAKSKAKSMGDMGAIISTLNAHEIEVPIDFLDSVIENQESFEDALVILRFFVENDIPIDHCVFNMVCSKAADLKQAKRFIECLKEQPNDTIIAAFDALINKFSSWEEVESILISKKEMGLSSGLRTFSLIAFKIDSVEKLESVARNYFAHLLISPDYIKLLFSLVHQDGQIEISITGFDSDLSEIYRSIWEQPHFALALEFVRATCYQGRVPEILSFLLLWRKLENEDHPRDLLHAVRSDEDLKFFADCILRRPMNLSPSESVKENARMFSELEELLSENSVIIDRLLLTTQKWRDAFDPENRS